MPSQIAAEGEDDLPVGVKMLMIAAANVVILGVSLICLHVGFSREHETPPSSRTFLWGEIAIIGLALLLSPILEVLRNGYKDTVRSNAIRGPARTSDMPHPALDETPADIGGEPPTDGSKSRWWTRQWWVNLAEWPNRVLWILAVLNFLTIGALVQATGGIISSPFNQFAIAIVVLSPYIMTGTNTPTRVLVAGVAYYGLLLFLEPASTSLDHNAGRGVYFFVTVVILIVSVLFIKQVRDATWEEDGR